MKYEVNTISCSDYAYIHSHHIAPIKQGTNFCGLAFTKFSGDKFHRLRILVSHVH